MYSEKDLEKHLFFRQELRSASCADLHDSLTGVICRPVILRFIHALIADGQEFTLAIFDLDNFKNINDNYGHTTGDGVLAAVAQDLKHHVGRDGVVGRLGGDEFLAVLFISSEYQAVHDYMDTIFAPMTVFRKNVRVDGVSPFITGTIGCASFPKDAGDYDTLFSKVDKALYRGKSKGRNCYIIYVPAKHDALEIPKLAGRSLYDTLRGMAEAFDAGGAAPERLRRAFGFLEKCVRVVDLLWIDGAGRCLRVKDGADLGAVPSVEPLITDGLYAVTNFAETERDFPSQCRFLKSLGLESVMICQANDAGRFGALIFCPELHTMHIWQDEEKAAAFVLCRMLSQALTRENAARTEQ